MFEHVAGQGARIGRIAPHLLEKLAGGRGFDVETAHGAAGAQQLEGRLVGEGIPGGVVDAASGMGFDGRQGVADHRQGAVAENVDFDQSGGLGLLLLPLDDRQPLCGHLHRHVPADFVGDHHQPAAVQGEVTQVAR